MHLEIFGTTAQLTTPTIADQYLPTKLCVGCRVEP
jgi:hypothetical protein